MTGNLLLNKQNIIFAEGYHENEISVFNYQNTSDHSTSESCEYHLARERERKRASM